MLEAYNTIRTLDALEARLPDDVEEVKNTLRPLLEQKTPSSNALDLMARCHLLCGETGEAKRVFESLIKRDPAQVSAKVELAKILHGENDTRAAIGLLKEATEAEPVFHENWRLLGEYLQSDGQKQASSNALAQYDMIKAFNINLQAAEQAFAAGDFQSSDKICRRLLEQVPNEVRTLRVLAGIARQFRYHEVSTSVLTRCIETRPNDVALGIEYVYSLLGSRMYQEAFEHCQKLIGLAPENISIYEVKAEVLYNLGQYEEAITIYRELSGVPEKREVSLVHLGKLLQTIGETKQAISCFHQAMEGESIQGQAWWELASLKAYRFSEEDIASMKQQLEAVETSSTNRILIQFALGKALEDARQFAESFKYYESANSAYIKSRSSGYSNQNAQLKSFFTKEYFSGKKENGNDSDEPVFVVGLPRSGSTLVEQILSTHSQVDATLELAEIISIARELNNSNQPGQGQYPRCMADLNAAQVQSLAQRYLDYAQTFRKQAPYFIDKAPGNFHHIGLIKTLFPNAKIIDIRRNPMASGWSLYKHFFADSFLFSYDLETIGKYYNEYIELMDHWHSVLPGQILTINYEDLVNDLPATTDALLQYCGLAFEEACLDFHQNKRAVATPSSVQVRQPIYSDALEHWRNYQEFLLPLQHLVEKQGLSSGAE